jgi:hypothetical protein
MSNWKSVLTLGHDLSIMAGNIASLCQAINRGADLNIFTSFRHNEHIDPASTNPELVEEVSQFPCTYLIDNRWAAGIMTWRQPVNPSNVATEFGPPSMSYFLYNQDGTQGIARPYLDGRKVAGAIGPSALNVSNTSQYRVLSNWDSGSLAPSENFIWYFEEFRFNVQDDWHEVLVHGPDGRILSGSIEQLVKAFRQGNEIKVGIRDLCADLKRDPYDQLGHEVFVRIGAGYYYTEQKLFIAATHNLVRVSPAIPLVYTSQGWDFGWVIVRTDGLTITRICDPYSLKFTDKKRHCQIRWFIR